MGKQNTVHDYDPPILTPCLDSILNKPQVTINKSGGSTEPFRNFHHRREPTGHQLLWSASCNSNQTNIARIETHTTHTNLHALIEETEPSYYHSVHRSTRPYASPDLLKS